MSKQRPDNPAAEASPDDTSDGVRPTREFVVAGTDEPVPDVILIDALHEPGKPPRFKPGQRVRGTVLARDEKTKQPNRIFHRKAELPSDCAVDIVEYVEGDSGKYRCTIARDDHAPADAKPTA